MKKAIFLFLITLPLFVFGQELDCCKTEKDVEMFLTGYWKINDSVSKVHYKFWFTKRQGNLTILELTEDNYEYIVLDDHPFVDIIENGLGFKLNFTDLSENRSSDLKYLDSKKMILDMNGETIEYLKIKE